MLPGKNREVSGVVDRRRKGKGKREKGRKREREKEREREREKHDSRTFSRLLSTSR